LISSFEQTADTGGREAVSTQDAIRGALKTEVMTGIRLTTIFNFSETLYKT
jgi:hypothetical protein